jgi:hypothetical protein
MPLGHAYFLLNVDTFFLTSTSVSRSISHRADILYPSGSPASNCWSYFSELGIQSECAAT